MIGMIQILIYLVDACLVFKGSEILQIALTGPVQEKLLAMLIDVFAVLASKVLAITFAVWGDYQAMSATSSMQR